MNGVDKVYDRAHRCAAFLMFSSDVGREFEGVGSPNIPFREAPRERIPTKGTSRSGSLAMVVDGVFVQP